MNRKNDIFSQEFTDFLINFINKLINIPFLNEEQEREVFRVVIEFLLQVLENQLPYDKQL